VIATTEQVRPARMRRILTEKLILLISKQERNSGDPRTRVHQPTSPRIYITTCHVYSLSTQVVVRDITACSNAR
jgi:hypothetical protein